MNKLLHYLESPRTLPERTLNQAVACVARAEHDLYGASRAEGAPYHTLILPAAGRLLAKESVIRKWFAEHFEVYVAVLAEHLETNPAIGWMDILSLSVPFRHDRLCLTLSLETSALLEPPQEPQAHHLRASLYWNWTGPRGTWDYREPAKAERAYHLVGEVPYVASFQTGFKVPRKELRYYTILQANPARLATPPHLTLLETASLVPPQAPEAPPKKPRPEGGQRGGPSKETPERAAIGDPRIFEEQQPAEVMKLPDGREFELVDWRDTSLPFGRRVQSKLAALMEVDHLQGKIYWASEDVLKDHPRYANRGPDNGAVPGKEVRMMHFTTKLGRISLTKRQLLWAYWTGEVPEEVRHRTYIHSQVRPGSLDGIYNLLAKGWKAGSEEEKKFIFENARKSTYWRDLNGNETLPILKDRAYTKTVSADFEPDTSSPETEIRSSRKLAHTIGKIFAAKVKKGTLSVEDAYERAIWFAHGKNHGTWISKLNEERPLPVATAQARAMLEPEELTKMNEAFISWKNSDAQAGTLRMAFQRGNQKQIERYGRYPEGYVNLAEQATCLIQEEFKVALGLLPADYGQVALDMEELAQSRGKAPE